MEPRLRIENHGRTDREDRCTDLAQVGQRGAHSAAQHDWLEVMRRADRAFLHAAEILEQAREENAALGVLVQIVEHPRGVDAHHVVVPRGVAPRGPLIGTSPAFSPGQHIDDAALAQPGRKRDHGPELIGDQRSRPMQVGAIAQSGRQRRDQQPRQDLLRSQREAATRARSTSRRAMLSAGQYCFRS